MLRDAPSGAPQHEVTACTYRGNLMLRRPQRAVWKQCARHGVDLEGGSPLQAVMTGTASQRQGRHREVRSEGSPRQNPAPTNRNRIRGRRGGVTRLLTGMPDSHSDTRGGKSCGDRGEDQRLTLGDLHRSWACPSSGPATASDGGGEVSRGHSSRAGCAMKGRSHRCKEQSEMTR